MPEGQVLEFTNVTKRFNEVTAVSDFSARVEPGAVTAFLGPNGAGKTTTLRILLGQVRATSGTATIGGVAYPELRQPLRTIGSVLEETAYRPRRTASRQLTIAAKANGIRLARVDEVISLVGLEGEADSRIGGFSLGMRQRLSVAHALLGDPGALVFDEPANGLDPEGIRWMRLLMRRLADEGRTVLVSSHVLSEIEQVADHVLVLSKGRLVLSSGIETLADPAGGAVVVDAVDRPGLTTALVAAGFDIEVLRSGLTVRGTDASRVGAVAADAGIALTTLVQRGPTLEDVFIDLMRGGRFDTTPALAQPASAATDMSDDAISDESTTDDATTDEAAAGVAASALAAGGSAALADDLSTDTPAETATADSAADDDPEDDATRVMPVIDDTVAPEPAPTEDAEPEPAETRSFDDIVFGTPAPAPAATESPRRSFAALFATTSAETSDDASSTTADPDAADPATEADATPADADAVPEDDTASPDGTVSPDGADSHDTDPSDEEPAPGDGPVNTDDEAPATDDPTAETAPEATDTNEEEPAGVEFFSDLGGAPSEDGAAVENAERSEPRENAGESASSEPATDSADHEDDDPRSAAVSSMLAAAARAYYEDEPRDYPLAPASEESGEESAQWSVAATGVIDTVPLASGPSPEGQEGSASADAAETAPAPADEQYQDEQPQDENHG